MTLRRRQMFLQQSLISILNTVSWQVFHCCSSCCHQGNVLQRQPSGCGWREPNLILTSCLRRIRRHTLDSASTHRHLRQTGPDAAGSLRQTQQHPVARSNTSRVPSLLLSPLVQMLPSDDSTLDLPGIWIPLGAARPSHFAG